jgi:hypothetical protein
MIVNHSIREYLHPHDIRENASFISLLHGILPVLLAYLLRNSETVGYGDIIQEQDFNGRWSGDRIEILGDYQDENLFLTIQEDYHNITAEALAEYTQNASIKPQAERQFKRIITDQEDQV